ncbi:N-formylglutamate amidohydrolase [Aquincola sp. J276]|uniref:N-formylglutamate amidohydrolase n=1 Tax=Aquincola sp. J276 TaxID=2898432 RepID=UPI0021509D26|nr:N-formylglutamate amidohydrolase [Aquincola sp. J276]MCR5864062.1 N-formylglutamate amidohydrolase [Aquincola sp. J276]
MPYRGAGQHACRKAACVCARAGRRLGGGAVSAHLPRCQPRPDRAGHRPAGRPMARPADRRPGGAAEGAAGRGLVWKVTDEGEAIYHRLLTVAEVQQRIERCWKPYHAAVAAEVDAAHARHGWCIHINCHSMPAVAATHATLYPGVAHADFVVGHRNGRTASPALSHPVYGFLGARGFSVD